MFVSLCHPMLMAFFSSQLLSWLLLRVCLTVCFSDNVLRKDKKTWALCDFGSSTTETYLCTTNADRINVGNDIEVKHKH